MSSTMRRTEDCYPLPSTIENISTIKYEVSDTFEKGRFTRTTLPAEYYDITFMILESEFIMENVLTADLHE
jgi:hypothetical protein